MKPTPSSLIGVMGTVLRFVALCTLFLARPHLAAAQTVDARASELTHSLMSPYCPELLLADCPSDGARELRAEITRRLEAGDTSAAIENDLVARFGSQIRTVPEFRGVGILAWTGPAVVGAGSLVLLIIVIRTSAHRQPDGDEQVRCTEAEDDLVALERLQRELDNLA